MKLSSITIELPSGEKLLGAVDMETGNTYTLSPYEIDTKGMVKIEDKGADQMDEEDFCYCHYDYEDEEHDCLDYMECEECPYYYEDLDQVVE